MVINLKFVMELMKIIILSLLVAGFDSKLAPELDKNDFPVITAAISDIIDFYFV